MPASSLAGVVCKKESALPFATTRSSFIAIHAIDQKLQDLDLVEQE
jgi:hypothetical protein